jgi:hypothetical protein
MLMRGRSEVLSEQTPKRGFIPEFGNREGDPALRNLAYNSVRPLISVNLTSVLLERFSEVQQTFQFAVVPGNSDSPGRQQTGKFAVHFCASPLHSTENRCKSGNCPLHAEDL